MRNRLKIGRRAMVGTREAFLGKWKYDSISREYGVDFDSAPWTTEGF